MRFPYDPVVPKKWEDLQIGSLCVKNRVFRVNIHTETNNRLHALRSVAPRCMK